MPYAFAHPAAVVPVARLLGSRAVPSALVIGSMIPDAWYFVPGLNRGHSHEVLGVLWFCLPAGLVVYAAFHLIFKEPMLALLPRDLAGRLAAWMTRGLPAVPWHYVLGSLLAGIATHLLWDLFTHDEHLAILRTSSVGGVALYRVLQHGSTIAGTLFLAWWIWRKLEHTKPRGGVPEVKPQVRASVIAALIVLPSAVFMSALEVSDAQALRMAVRGASVAAVSTFGLIALMYSVAWKRRGLRTA